MPGLLSRRIGISISLSDLGWEDVMADLLVLFLVIAGQFVLIPLVGASMLLLSARSIGVAGQLTFLEGWKTYLIALTCGLSLVVLLNFLVPWGGMGGAAVLALQLALTCLTHFFVILFRLRRYSCRALLAQGGAVLATNLIGVSLVLSLEAVVKGISELSRSIG